MLVATPGQTAAYQTTLLQSATNAAAASKQICHNSLSNTTTAASTSSKATAHNNNLMHKQQQHAATETSSNGELTTLDGKSSSCSSATNAASALMKSLSVRLNRGTEFLKGTVQKALINAAAAKTQHNATISNLKATTTTGSINVFANHTTAAATTSATTKVQHARIVPTAAYLKQYTVPPTAAHYFPNNGKTDKKPIAKKPRGDSTNSLQQDLCFFKPIHSAPTTPLKCNSKSRGANLRIPKPKRALALDSNSDDDDDDEDEESGAHSRLLFDDKTKRSKTHQYLSQDSVRIKLAKLIRRSPLQRSAFVNLIEDIKRPTKMSAHKMKTTKKTPHISNNITNTNTKCTTSRRKAATNNKKQSTATKITETQKTTEQQHQEQKPKKGKACKNTEVIIMNESLLQTNNVKENTRKRKQTRKDSCFIANKIPKATPTIHSNTNSSTNNSSSSSNISSIWPNRSSADSKNAAPLTRARLRSAKSPKLSCGLEFKKGRAI